jgi:hypothetical protein
MLLFLLLLLAQQALRAASTALLAGSGKALDVALAVAAKERVQHNSTTPATRPDQSQITLILEKKKEVSVASYTSSLRPHTLAA